MEKMLDKGEKICSRRTGKILECYNVMSVYMGNGNTPVRYEYSFVTEGKQFRTVKEQALKEML